MHWAPLLRTRAEGWTILRSARPCPASWMVKKILRAIPGLEVVELDVPIVSTQASHLSVLPKFKAELREREFRAAAETGVTTFASIFHGCHRELVKFQPEVSFELLNFSEESCRIPGADGRTPGATVLGLLPPFHWLAHFVAISDGYALIQINPRILLLHCRHRSDRGRED